MSEEIEVYGQKPLTVQEVMVHIRLLQEVLEKVMKKGQHYDTIPGTSKPTLLKPGAEKILATFRLGVDPIVEDLSNGSILRYRVKCNIKTFNGIFVGAGVGEASSEEEKYKWRSIVSEKEWEAIPENMRRIKYTRNGTVKQIRTNPYDIANTILKMAKKRAMVDGTLTVTAASDIFTQDIEDMPEEIITGEIKPKPKQEFKVIAHVEDGKLVDDSKESVKKPDTKPITPLITPSAPSKKAMTPKEYMVYLLKAIEKENSDFYNNTIQALVDTYKEGFPDNLTDVEYSKIVAQLRPYVKTK